jgi:hypothetical protein
VIPWQDEAETANSSTTSQPVQQRGLSGMVHASARTRRAGAGRAVIIAFALIVGWLVYREHQRRAVARRLAILRLFVETIARERGL